MGVNLTEAQKVLLVRARAQAAGAIPVQVVPQVVQPVQPTVLTAATTVDELLDWAALMTQYDLMASASDAYLKLHLGQNKIRFLMNPQGHAFYAMRMQAYIPAPPGSGEKGHFVVSPRTTDPNAFCPLVQLSNKLRASATDPATKKLASDLWPSEQLLSNVLAEDVTSGRWGMSVLQYGRMIFRALIVAMQTNIEDGDIDAATGMVSDTKNIANPSTGIVVCITKSGDGLNTNYEVNLTSKVLSVTAEQLGARKNFAELCTPTPVEEISGYLCALFGVQQFDQLLAENVVLQAPNAGTTQIAVPPVAIPVAPIVQPSDDDLFAVPVVPPLVAAPVAEAIYPACVGSMGTPLPGHACATCAVLTDCQAVTLAK